MALNLRLRRQVLAAGDVVALGAGWVLGVLAGATRLDGSVTAFQEHVLWVLAPSLVWFLWLYGAELYDLRRAARPVNVAARVLAGGAVVLAVYLVLFYLGSAWPGAPRVLTAHVVPLAGWAMGLALLLVWRLAWAHRARRDPAFRRRVLVLGAGQSGHALADEMLREGRTYEVVGFVDDDPAKAGDVYHGAAVIGSHADLPALVSTLDVHLVALCISLEVRGSVFQALVDLGAEGPEVAPMPLVYERLTGRVAVEEEGGQWLVAVPVEPFRYGLGGRIAKRALDVLGGLVLGLLCLAALPFVALAIRLDSRGPVFYRQMRLGLHGRPYHVVKFRSMVFDAEREGGAQWAQPDDARVTRIGRFLRRTRLDELPQALNVLRGEMSLVGPRPERPEIVAELQRQIPFYRARLAVRPGLTGWAQVRYGYGASVEDALVKLQYDLYYLRHRSFTFDLYVLARTIPVILMMQGR